MSDPTISILMDACQNHSGRLLWLADEHHNDLLHRLKSIKPDTVVLSNRCDLATAASKAGLEAQFNDWIFPERQFDIIALRICKEKQVNLHLLQQAILHLQPNGTLLICGEKNDGIKTYCKRFQDAFELGGKPQKIGLSYLCEFKNPIPASSALASEYHELIPIMEVCGFPIYSKPGIFGWNKIDQGSALLIEQFRQYCRDRQPNQFNSLLDLGCGYGYLSFALADLDFKLRVATDNNAAAIAACQYTAEQAQFPLRVIAADCAEGITEKFEVILCNPPFHKGFDVQGDLTSQFLRNAQARLGATGSAFFVVNSFIGIEKKAQKFFSHIEQLANNHQFKVLRLSR